MRGDGIAARRGAGTASPRLEFKAVTEPWELEEVHRLNYRTFVEEIPQHPGNPERVLRDRLLGKSDCFVCLSDGAVRGMVAVSSQRPFSLDAKLPDLDRHLPPHRGVCEVRLLAVERERRGGPVFAGLLGLLLRHLRERGFDLGVISAAASQQRLYRHLGFVPFGPPLGTDRAPYQGMYVTWDRMAPAALRLSGEAR